MDVRRGLRPSICDGYEQPLLKQAMAKFGSTAGNAIPCMLPVFLRDREQFSRAEDSKNVRTEASQKGGCRFFRI